MSNVDWRELSEHVAVHDVSEYARVLRLGKKGQLKYYLVQRSLVWADIWQDTSDNKMTSEADALFEARKLSDEMSRNNQR